MTLEIFFDNFGRLAEAPRGVHRLRDLVIGLAVSGRLAEGSEAEETASTLLRRISAEREREVRPSRRKRGELLPIEEDQVPFPVPARWKWCRLGHLAALETGKRMKGGARSEGVISLGGEHLRPDGTVDYGVPRCISEEFFETLKTGKVKQHDTLMVKDGATTGKTAFVDDLPPAGRAAVNEHVFLIRCSELMSKRLFFLFTRYLAQQQIAAQSKGIIGGVTRGPVLNLAFPLPPLTEQHRIVAKVDQLMALCDELEARQQKRNETRLALNSASLDRLLTAPDGEAFSRRWHRIRDYFEPLYDCSETVPQLRKAIIQLGVQGGLTRRDWKDEPVEDLLRGPHPLPPGYCRLRKTKYRGHVDLSGVSLPQLPESWARLSIQDLYDLGILLDFADGNHGSLYPRKHEFGAEGEVFVTARQIDRGSVDLEGAPRLDTAKARTLTKGWARGGDVLLTHNATVGRVARVPKHVGDFLLGTSVTFYRLNSSKFDPDFLFYCFLSESWQAQMREVMEQTTRNQVSIQKQAFFMLPVPPFSEQGRIAERLDSLMALCDELEAKLQQSQAEAEKLMASVVHHLLAV